MNIPMIIAILFFPTIILLFYVSAKITDYCYEYDMRKHKEKYKDLYVLESEYVNARHDECMWEQHEVEYYEKQIDEILNKMKYYPEEEREFYETRLFTLRAVYKDKARVLEEKKAMTEVTHENLRRYVKDNNINWYNAN